MAKEKPKNLGQSVSQNIEAALTAFLSSPDAATTTVADAKAKRPSDVATKLDAVLGLREVSYRDGIIIQLAFGLADASLDWKPAWKIDPLTGGIGVEF